MAGGLAKLQLTLEIDGDKAVITGLNNVEQSVGRMASEAQSAGGRMSSSFKEMAGAFTVGGLITKGVEMLIASLGKLKDSLVEMALMAARAETLGVAMRVVGNNAGYSGAEMDAAEKSVRKMGIATIEARESLTKMAGSQMELSKASGLARVAQDAAVIGNINSSDAFARMIQGIRSGEVEILKTIGINVQFEQSYRKLEDQLGRNRGGLTEVEKVQARTNAVMEYGINISGAYDAAMGTTGKQLTSLKRYYDDLKIAAGEAFNPLLGVAVVALTDALKALGIWMETNKAAFKEFAADLASMGKAVMHPIDSTFNAIFGAFNVSEETGPEARARYKESDRLYKEMIDKKAEQRRLEAAEEAKAAQVREAAAKKTAEAIKLLRTKEAQDASDRYQLVLQDQKKVADAEKKARDEAMQEEKAMLKAMEAARWDYSRDITKLAQDTEKEMQQGFEDSAKNYEKYQKDMAAAEKKAREDLYKWQVAHDPMSGALAALKEYSDFAKQVGYQTGQLVTNMFYEMEDAFTSFLRTGKLDFKNFIDSLLDDLARMAVKQGITGPLSSMLGNLMSGTAATYLPQTAAGSAGLLDGTSAGGLSSLVGGMQSAVAAGAQSGTAAGASAGVSSGMAAFGPYFAAAAGVYLVAADLFKPGGVWNQSGGNQRTQQALLYSNPFGWAAAGLNQFTGGGLLGTKWRSTASGLQLGISAGEIEALNYQDSAKKKSFYRGTSRRTDYSAVDSQMQDYLNSSYNDVLASIRVQSATLGNRISEEAVKGFTSATTKINLAGLDGDAQQKALADYFRGVSNEALALLVPDIASQIRLGEDATAAYARLNALKLTNNALLMRELELLGQGSGSRYKELLATQREAELLGVDASTAAIQRRIWALEDEQQIMEAANATRLASLSAEMELARKAADLWRAAGQTLDQSIAAVAAVGLSPEAQLASLRGQFAAAVGKFQGGDVTAAGQVSSLARDLQSASRDYYASGSGFASDSAALQATLSSLSNFASSQASGADIQVAGMQTQIDQMKTMNVTLNKIASSLDTIESKTSLADSAPLSKAA